MEEKSVIALIIDMVRLTDFYNKSEAINIAKGKYQLPSSYKGIVNTIKRNKKIKENGN
jgi:hypothetical protein